MYTSTLEFEGIKFKGTMDMNSLKSIQEDLLSEGIKTTIPNIFKKISEYEMTYISSFVLNTLSSINEKKKDEFLGLFLTKTKDDLQTINRYNSIFSYINDLMARCLPKVESKEESIFEDDDLLYEDKDWELSHMEFMWNSVINRSDNFWNITPKNYFEQFEIYKKFNNIKDEKVEDF